VPCRRDTAGEQYTQHESEHKLLSCIIYGDLSFMLKEVEGENNAVAEPKTVN
jgi:hypothetical protein